MTAVGIVGAGTMGAGIAQVALEAGDDVVLHDVEAKALDRARERIRDGLARTAARLELDADTIDAWTDGRLARLRTASAIGEVAASCGLVIEAVVEELDRKRSVFAALDAQAAPDTILATNTSAIPVGAIAAAVRRPERLIGLHFFHPVARMPLVELVVPDRADPSIVDRAAAWMTGWGRTVVRCADTPGFIVNRVNRPFTIQALRAVERGEASPETIDAAVREAGFPMGPFELMDLVGIDVNLAAANGVWAALGRPEHLRPSPIQEAHVAAGRLGRKTGEGFYAYKEGRRIRGEARGDAGPVVERILAGIEREARTMAEADLATPHDIDLALRAGAGHPMGPFERAEAGLQGD